MKKRNDGNYTIAIIIPALNEEEAIGQTIEKIPIEGEVIVVDNGSTDRTAEIARKKGALVIEEQRKGYGYACLAGINYLRGLDRKPDIVVFLDADGADDPGEILRLVRIKQMIKKPGMVMGSRFEKMRPYAMPAHAIVANKILIWLIRVLYRVNLTDMGPLRVIDFTSLLELKMQDTGYGWASEMIVKLLKNGYHITEVPVVYRPRVGVSKISGSLFTSIKAAIWLTMHIFRHSLGR